MAYFFSPEFNQIYQSISSEIIRWNKGFNMSETIAESGLHYLEHIEVGNCTAKLK